MKRFNHHHRLVALFLAPFLALLGSAQAQLEYLAETTNIAEINDADLHNILDQIGAGRIYQVKITGSIIPTVDTSGSPFGINEMSSTPVPAIAYVMVDTTRTGPKVTGGGLHGYQGSQILAVYIHIGPENNPLHEIGYVNFPPLTSDFSPSTLTPVMSGGPSAELWVNQDLDTGTPTIASIRLENGMDSFRFGPLHAPSGILGGVYVQEESSYSTGDVTSVQMSNLTALYGTFLTNRELRQIAFEVAKSQLAKIKKKLAKSKKKARRLKSKADDRKSRIKAKKARKEVIIIRRKELKPARRIFNESSNEITEVRVGLFGDDTVMNFDVSGRTR